MIPEKKLKIFVDAHGFDKEFQGSRTFIKEIYGLLAKKQDIQLYMGAFDVRNLLGNFGELQGIKYIKYRSRSAMIRLLIEIPFVIRKYGIDYAHFQYVVPVVKNCRFIVTMHDVLFMEFKKEFSFYYRSVRRFFCKMAVGKADLLTTVSSFSKVTIEKHLEVDPGSIHVVRNGIGYRYFESFNKQTEVNYIRERFGVDKYILCVSRLEPRKNHAMLLRAYVDLRLHLEGYWLVLLGHQSIKTPEFERILGSLPKEIRSRVFISSKINDDDLLSFYRAASLFVYPSKAEGFGIPPLEAAAVKIPVICSNTTAMRSFTFFGKNHLDPGDYERFRSGLSAIIQSPPGEISLERIAEKIRQEYTWERQAEKLYSLILGMEKN
jgi:glycosyltransferase involved in cell wall biosynthesis